MGVLVSVECNGPGNKSSLVSQSCSLYTKTPGWSWHFLVEDMLFMAAVSLADIVAHRSNGA